MINKKRNRTNFNSNMHKDILYYNNPPDFKLLSQLYPSFTPFVHYKSKSRNYSIDWNNAQAVKELNKCLLKKDFSIEYWEIPDGFLIPTLTSRLNYLYWLNDIIQDDMKILLNRLDIKPLFQCIDIGTGANCIYPLLGHKVFKWIFIASDINNESIRSATNIISKNQLTNVITLVHQLNPKHIFINLPIGSHDKIMFSMCNPPFFDSLTEIKHDNPNTDNEYNYNEVYCEGGEIEFIIEMIKESNSYKSNVCWFTTLIGKKADLIEIRKILDSSMKIKRIQTTTFYQGKTVRWGIAWSYYNSYEEFMIDLHYTSNTKQQPIKPYYNYNEY